MGMGMAMGRYSDDGDGGDDGDDDDDGQVQ